MRKSIVIYLLTVISFALLVTTVLFFFLEAKNSLGSYNQFLKFAYKNCKALKKVDEKYFFSSKRAGDEVDIFVSDARLASLVFKNKKQEKSFLIYLKSEKLDEDTDLFKPGGVDKIYYSEASVKYLKSVNFYKRNYDFKKGMSFFLQYYIIGIAFITVIFFKKRKRLSK